MRISSSALGLAAAALALFAGVSAKADPLTINNAGFETTSLSGSSQFGSDYGGDTVSGWTASGYTFLFTPGTADTTGAAGQYGNVQLWGPGNGSNNGLIESPDGGNYVAMDGAFQNGSISQVLTGLTVGDIVQVGFWYAGAQQSGFDGPTTEGFQVSLGDQVQNTPQLPNGNHGFTGWQYATFDFSVTSTTETLKFLAQGTPTGEPPFTLLDGVSAVQTTPEPGSLVLLATGMAGAAGALRRRFRAAV